MQGPRRVGTVCGNPPNGGWKRLGGLEPKKSREDVVAKRRHRNGKQTGVVVRLHVVVDVFRGHESRPAGVRGRAVENDLTAAGLSKLKA